MDLRKPKKKRRPKLQAELPFPIVLGDQNEWVTYTAHLTDVGAYVTEQSEIIALHSKGFFGKASLSRAFPAFGKARYGAPPVIRNRQWIRRQDWMQQFNRLCMEGNNECTSGEENKFSTSQSENVNKDNEHQADNSNGAKENFENVNDPEEGDILSDNEKDVIQLYDNIDNEQKECAKQREIEPHCNMDVTEDDICFLDDDTNVETKLLVLPDSDSETENYLKEIKPKIECESFPVQESLHLTSEETFFLLYGLGCLNLVNFDGTLLDIDSAWNHFCKRDKNFITKYIVYHYFRSKGWVVKPGLKYGGNFLLYKQGPPFYHASYIVIIDVLDGDTLIRDQSKCMHKLTWNNLLGLERLSETAAKEILFAQILWPSSVPLVPDNLNLDILQKVSVRELLWRRWKPNHNATVDADDDSC